MPEFREIELSKIRANDANIRSDIGDMEALTAETKTIGIRNPLIVYPHPELDGDYLVQDGHRRLRAAQTNGALFVPCLVVEAPKRGRKEDIEVMLSTGKGAKVLNPLEVSFGFEQLLAEGLDETTIAKKYKIPKSQVLSRARVTKAPSNLQEQFASGQLDLEQMKRIQDLEDAGDTDVFDTVVGEIENRTARGGWFKLETVIAESEIKVERERVAEKLKAAGAVQCSATYDFIQKHERVEADLTIAEHVEAGHEFTFTYGTSDPVWYAKRVKVKAELSAEEIAERETVRSLDSGLAIQARVRQKFLVDRVLAKPTSADAVADFELLFTAVWRSLEYADTQFLAAITGIQAPDDSDADDVAAEDANAEWYAKVEKRLRSFTWQQLVRAWVISWNAETSKSFASTNVFDGPMFSWRRAREWYRSLQNNFGYRLDDVERRAIAWAQERAKGNVLYADKAEGFEVLD